jgi:hypothetical protein
MKKHTFFFLVTFQLNGRLHNIDWEVDAISHNLAWLAVCEGFDKAFEKGVKVTEVRYLGVK